MSKIKSKTFSCYKDYDSYSGQVYRRFKKMKKKALKWASNKNVINIKEDYYDGGHWEDEMRGGEITIFYKG